MTPSYVKLEDSAIPVDLRQALEFLRVPDDEAGVVRFNLSVATEMVEEMTNRSLRLQKYLACWDRWPEVPADRHPLDATRVWGVALPTGPLVSIESVKYYDEAGVLQTLSPSAYFSDVYVHRLNFTPDADLPGLYPRTDAVQVTYTSGAVSDAGRMAVLLLARHLFDNPSAVADRKVEKMPYSFDFLIRNLRL